MDWSEMQLNAEQWALRSDVAASKVEPLSLQNRKDEAEFCLRLATAYAQVSQAYSQALLAHHSAPVRYVQ